MKIAVSALVLLVTIPAAPALADCEADLNRFVESFKGSHEKDEAPPAVRDSGAEDPSATEIATADVAEDGTKVTEDGGTTTYAATGPALPAENWLGIAPENKAVAEKISEAQEYATNGDESACSDALVEAKKLNESSER